MKVILLTVVTINGKTTRNTEKNIYTWTSSDEQKIFFKKLEKAQAIVMGAKTYESARHLIKHKKGRLRVVLTRNLRKYAKDAVFGFLEFTKESPREIYNRFEKKGISEMLLLGGSKINTLFLKEKLIDEIHVSIEPLIFGQGKGIIAEEELEVSLELTKVNKLNKKGTLILVYKVKK